MKRALILTALLLASSAMAQDGVDTRSNFYWTVPSSHPRSHFYTFEPKDDITAPELSKILVAILPALVCHNMLGCDPSDNIAALPSEARRHFVEHYQ